jgi:hypothetical protein
MSGAYFNVSGIDQNEDAEIVFVRYRSEDQEVDILLGSGRVVGGGILLPGIQVGQFSITFRVPNGCLVDNIVLSRDKGGKELLSGATLTRCLIRAEAPSGGTIVPDNPPMRTGGASASSHSINRGQIIMAQQTGSEP